MKLFVAVLMAIGLVFVASAPIDLSDEEASRQVAAVNDVQDEGQKRDMTPLKKDDDEEVDGKI